MPQLFNAKIYARVADAKGANVFGMPGGRVIRHLPFGVMLPLAGNVVWYQGIRFFPVQVDMSIMWASEQGFVILRERT
jgi:hypothetical protein